MCGLAGVVDASTQDDARTALVTAMTATLEHRGPVGSRVVTRPAVSLGHTALPLCHGAVPQPFTTASGRFTLVLNGELYGLEQLRARLRALGFDGAARSDTEVLAALVEAEGVHAFDGVEGMFAAVAVDHEHREVLLARDRRGKKPLFVADLGPAAGWPRLVTASELTTVLLHPDVPPDLDAQVLGHYLAVRSVPAPATALAHVAQVPPGTVLRVTAGGTTTHRIAAPADDTAPRPLVAALAAAVHERVTSTSGPVGVLLSGGVDSAVVAALASRVAVPRPTAYTARFAGSHVDEGDAAAVVCARLGLPHRERVLTLDDLAAEAHLVLDGLDQPLADPSLLPLRLVAQTAAQDVRVVLTGDGADELFYGYRWFEAEALLWRLRHVPHPLVRTAFRLLASRAAAAARLPLAHHAADLARAVGAPPGDGFVAAHSGVADEVARQLLPSSPGAAPSARPAATVDAQLELARAQVVRRFLVDTVLTKVDRGTMAYGLEARSPFLADAVWRLGTTARPAQCRAAGRGKAPVRDVARELLGADVADRQKSGFRAPLAQVLRGPLRDRLADTLAPAVLGRVGTWHAPTVGRLLAAHLQGRADHAQVLWTVLVHVAWAQRVGGTHHRALTHAVGGAA